MKRLRSSNQGPCQTSKQPPAVFCPVPREDTADRAFEGCNQLLSFSQLAPRSRQQGSLLNGQWGGSERERFQACPISLYRVMRNR